MKRSKGFTLIELLIVIVLLGILISLGLTSYMSALKKSRDSKRKNDLRQIAVSLEAYYNDKGHYPFIDATGTGEFKGCPNDITVCAWGVPFVDSNGTIYMPTIPGEALSSQKYDYLGDGTYFQLYAHLENTLDADIPKSGGKSRVFSDTNNVNCGTPTVTVECNYGVSSSNTTITQGRSVTYE